MKNKNEYAKEERVTVYQFMEMCGLKCDRKRNILLSHKAMRKKLIRRYYEFSGAITIPVALPTKNIEKSDVKEGKIILVEDDYKNVIPYLRPALISFRKTVLTEEDKRKVEETIERKNKEIEGNYIDSLKPGELKYMIKKEQRQLQEEQHQIEEMILEDREDALAGFTEDQVKVRTKKIRYY